MKIVVVFIIFSILTLSVNAQTNSSKQIPAVVKEAFAKQYPKITDVKWTKESKFYESEFIDDGIAISINFDKSGKITETETEINITSLPQASLDYFIEHYAGYKISEAAKIVNSKGIVRFEAEIQKGKIKKDLIFDKDGKLIK